MVQDHTEMVQDLVLGTAQELYMSAVAAAAPGQKVEVLEVLTISDQAVEHWHQV